MTQDEIRKRIRGSFPGLEIRTEDEAVSAYTHDEAFKAGRTPAAVVFPKNTADVQTVFRFASKHRIPVVPRGAGTGLAGAAVPVTEAIVLSLERMNRILEIDEESCVAVVEPGVITGEIRKAVEERGLFYPPIPASVDSCTIGGNVATNAGGLCAVKYGVTREYVLGLEVVLADGTVFETGGRILKNSTAYNLTQLICGSEGTLGVITKITVKLVPLPRERATLLVPFASAEDLSKTVVDLLAERVVPPTLELIPGAAVECVLRRHSELSFPFPDAPASLLIELDSRHTSGLDAELETLEPVLNRRAVAPPLVAATPAQREELWSIRKLIRDSVATTADYEEADSVVPRRRLPELIRAAEETAARFGLTVISYGHAGDGNLHTYFRRTGQTDVEWGEKSKAALKEFFRRTVALGGMLSGEHGIGYLKREYLSMALSREQIDLMRRLKAAFDPLNLLNPGKVFPE